MEIAQTIISHANAYLGAVRTPWFPARTRWFIHLWRKSIIEVQDLGLAALFSIFFIPGREGAIAGLLSDFSG